MPVLTRMPKQRVKTQVVCLAPGAVPAAVLRQSGVPVHDVALSRQRFSFGGFGELVKAAKAFRPDVIHAWGYTAQIFANQVRKRCDRKIKVVWTVGNTAPLPRGAGMIDRRKIKYAAKAAPTADRIVYASEAGAAQHRRAGFPEGEHLTIPPGIDATRFKPDPAARLKIREQLHLAPEAFVIGMVAPFQPEYDHPTFLKAVGELIKIESAHFGGARRARRAERQCAADGAGRRRHTSVPACSCSANGRIWRRCSTPATSCARAR